MMAVQVADQRSIKSIKTNGVLSSLHTMGYEEDYILRAVAVHKKSKKGTNYDLSLLVEIISRLKLKDSKKHNDNNHDKPSKLAFVAHFECMDEALKLNINDNIDYRFENGRVILCKILDKTMDDINKHYVILLHPLGQPLSITKHNRYCDLFTEYHLLAPPKSISLRKLTNKKHVLYDIQIDDYLDINPRYKSGHNGWKLGRVIKTDPNSGQIKAVYYNHNDHSNYSYWVHLENINEAAPFKTKCIDENEHHEHKTDVLQSPTGSISNIDYWHNINNINIDFNASGSNISTTQQTPPPPPIHGGPTMKYSTDWMHNSLDSVISNNSYNNHMINGYAAIKASKFSTDWIQSSMDSVISNSSHHSHDNHHHNLMNGHNLNGKRLSSKPATSSYSNLHGFFSNTNQSDTVDIDDQLIGKQSKQCTQSKTDEIMHQLYTFGYNDNDIKQAMDNVSNPYDINQIIEYIGNNNNNNNIHYDEDEEDEEDDDAKNDHLSDDEWSPPQNIQNIQNTDNKNGVFGVESIMLRSTLIPNKDYGAPIPNILIKLKKELFQNNGQFLEGIFRINPNNAKCKQIQDEINNNYKNIENTDFAEINGALIANLIQIWFKKLPQPILYDLDYNKMKECKTMNTAGELIENDIGEPNESYFKWLLDLCIDITKHENVNKMSIKNMAIVIAPNLYNLHKNKHETKAMVDFMVFSILWRHFSK